MEVVSSNTEYSISEQHSTLYQQVEATNNQNSPPVEPVGVEVEVGKNVNHDRIWNILEGAQRHFPSWSLANKRKEPNKLRIFGCSSHELTHETEENFDESSAEISDESEDSKVSED